MLGVPMYVRVSFARQIFRAIDVNNDGMVEFNELLVVIVLMSRLNSVESRLAFAFDMSVSVFSSESKRDVHDCLGGTAQRTASSNRMNWLM